MDEKKLKKLEEILNLVQEGISKEEFVNSFENILKQIISLEEKLVKRMDIKLGDTQNEIDSALKSLEPLKERFEQAIKDAQEANDTTFAGVRQRATESIDGLFNKMRLKDKFNVIIDEYAGKIEQLNSKIQEVNPDKIIKEVLNKIPPQKIDTAEEERDRLESLKGDERLKIEAIKNLREELDELKKSNQKQIYPIVGGNSGGGRIVKSYDISATLNGVLKTFSLPAFWRIISVTSSSFPYSFRETVDWTADATLMQITFTSAIDAASTLATGQTITITYSEA